MRRYDADSILWNWARWSHSGPRVGNMEDYFPYDDPEFRLLACWQAETVDQMHRGLPHSHQMVINAEYPQRYVRFNGLGRRARAEKARRWIYEATSDLPPKYEGVWLRDFEYERILTDFKKEVEERFL